MSDAVAQSTVKRALRAVTALQQQVADLEAERTAPLAIVGQGCRWPGGATSPAQYWAVLCGAEDVITEVPPSRWDRRAWYHPDPEHPGTMYVDRGGFLGEIDGFDRAFFRMSPREAQQLDPQQRLLLETAWEALERAGLRTSALRGSDTGVFLGATTNDYASLLMARGADTLDGFFFTGNPLNTAAGRLAYVLGLRGPALTIDTACSSSLVALHQACEALRRGECSLALVGAANLLLDPRVSVAVSRTRALAPDGRCKAFSAQADGFVRSEGCAVLVVKRLADAEAQGDPILAVIRGSAVNHDGASSGFTAPNGDAQQAVMRRALGALSPASVSYLEAHGTGTALGDPIEIRAAAAVYGVERSSPLLMGSAKAHIGHCEAASGLAGVMKVVLALQHEQLPGQIHASPLTPHVDWDALPVRVVDRSTPWVRGAAPRRAAVSAFGASGTNAHVILEEAPNAPAPDLTAMPSPSSTVLLLSARSPEALRTLTEQMAEQVAPGGALSSTPVAALAATVSASRTSHACRSTLVVSSMNDLREQLATRAAAADAVVRVPGAPPKTALLFTGQGSHYVGMGARLYEMAPIFRATIDRCDELLRPMLTRSLTDLLWRVDRDVLADAAHAQPALFAVGIALAEQLKGWGVYADAVLGHSLGEFAAAVSAGALTLEDGAVLAAERGRLMSALPADGAMAAVLAPAETVRALLATTRSGVELAADNGPGHVVLSGRVPDVEQAIAEARAHGHRAIRLDVSHAFHSAQIDPVLEPFRAVVRTRAAQAPTALWVSTLTGAVQRDAPDDAYWVRQAREPVQFGAALSTLYGHGYRVFVEIGPRATLTAMAREAIPAADAHWLAAMHPHGDDGRHLHTLLATLHDLGCPVDWDAVLRDALPAGARSVIAPQLPTYPFQRERCWLPDLLSPAPTVALPSSPPSAPDVTSRKQEILDVLTADIAAAMQMPANEVPPDVPFLELGADSIVMVDAIAVIEKRYGVKLALRQFFEELSTLDAVATHLDAAIAPAAPPIVTVAAAAPPPFIASAVPGAIPAMPVHLPAGDAAALMQRMLLDQQQLMSQFLSHQSELLRAMYGSVPVAAAPVATPVATPVAAPVAARVAAPVAAPSASSSTAAVAKPMMPWGSGSETRKRGLSEQQASHLDALVARYTARTAASKAQAQRYRRPLADSRATVGFRLSTKELLYPISGARSDGSRLWDIDGNEYVDYTMGFGVHLLGHRPPAVQPAIEAAVSQAVELGMRSDVVGDVAELMTELTGLDRFAFTNSGTEAVMAAVRLARARTGRDKLVIFSGAYHGHADVTLARSAQEPGRVTGVPLVGGVPARQTDDVLVLEYGDEAALETIRAHGHEIAAVMVEPVQSRNPRLQPREFLHALRALTRETGSALIFDEMITGFRAHQGGAQAYFGVQADLASYGKIIGGGLPIGAVGGMADWMDGIDGGFWQYGDMSYPPAERTAFGGTFCQHPLSMAAARAVLRHLKAEGPSLQETLNARTGRLVSTLNDFFREEEVPITTTHFSSLFRFEFSSNLDLLFYHMLEKGIYIWEWRSCFLSTAHSDEDVDRFVVTMQETIDEMRQGGFVPPRTAPRTAPTTVAQRQLVAAAALDPAANSAYQLRTAVALEGALDVPALTQAVQEVVSRHSALRTSLPEGESDRQRIRPSVRMQLPIIDLTETPAARDAALTTWREHDSRLPMSLAHGPLFRAALLRTDVNSHVLVLTAHHVIADGFTMGVVLRDLAACYNAFRAGHHPALEPAVAFEDYVAQQTSASVRAEMEAHREYWVRHFADGVPELLLPTDHPRPTVRSYAGAARHTEVPGDVLTALRALARSRGCTLHMALSAVFTLLLHRLTAQDDLVLGMPVLGRSQPADMHVVGYCTHLLPLRSRLGAASFADHLDATRATMLSAFDHQALPFAELLTVIGARRAPDAPPLTPVVFNLEPIGAAPVFDGLSGTLLPDVVTATPFELFVNVVDAGDRLLVEGQYNTDLFDGDTIDGVLSAFTALLADAVSSPHTPVAALSMLPAGDREWLAEVNATGHPYPCHTLTELLAGGLGRRAADPTGANVMVMTVHDGMSPRRDWSAVELEGRSNQLAHHLRRAHAVGPGVFVGVCAQRGAPMVVALLAIIKAGGAYVPLDPTLPPARLAYQLADCGASLVLYPADDEQAAAALGAACAALPAECHAPILCAVGEQALGDDELQEPLTAPAVVVTGSDPAYLIYTSGSTGRPKGAINTHAGIANRLQWMQQQYVLTSRDRVLQKTPFGFDVSVWEFFWPLMTDAALVVARPDGHTDPAYLVRCVREAEITTMHFVPSMLAVWMDSPEVARVSLGEGGPLRQVMVSGEALSPSVAARWGRSLPGVYLHNLYGPTEAAVDVSYWPVPDDFDGDVVPIGRPVANTTLHVLDVNGMPCPVGIAGELWIGGVQVGAGYHGRDALTAERFVADPSNPGERRYRTGDRAKWTRRGVIEFLGRLDDQIKLRGHRIELGEIESVLLAVPGVREVAVVVQEPVSGHPQLVAFVSPQAVCEQPGDVEAMWRTMRAQLPAAMVPSRLVPLPQLPRLASGKVDRRALPAVGAEALSDGTGNEAPLTPTEAAIAAVWCSVLRRPHIGRHDNFFALGGDSLLAMQALAQLGSEGISHATLRDVFLHPTVAGQAALTPRDSAEQFPALEPVPNVGPIPLSPAQRPWWLREQLGLAATAPAPSAFRLRGPLNVPALRQALEQVVARHEILRTVFREEDGVARQIVRPIEDVVLPFVIVNGNADGDDLAADAIAGAVAACARDLVATPMRLDEGPLFRLAMIRVAADHHVLVCSMHHIITDGVSLHVFTSDLAAAYAAVHEGRAPAWVPLAVQFRDIVHWQEAVLDTPAAAMMTEYWRAQLADVPRLALPTDRPRGHAPFVRAQRTQLWGAEMLRAVDDLVARTGHTRFLVLQAALKAMLYRETAQHDVCIGTPVSTRMVPAIEPQIGPYMNVVALRDQVGPDDDFATLLDRVRHTTSEGLSRRLVPFDVLVDRLRRREPGRQPLFDVGFTLQSQAPPSWPAESGLTMTAIDSGLLPSDDAEALTDLWFIVRSHDADGAEGVTVDLVYNGALFTASTADRLLSNWQRVLSTVLADPARSIGTLPFQRRPPRKTAPAISIAFSTT